MYKCVILIVLWCHFAICRDFYVGMFKKNDILVAQDRLFKERVPFRSAYAKYGRKFKCPITYFRVVDRLGYGKGPRVEIIRGGLKKYYIVLRLQSAYNTPISVNIYVGCENKLPKRDLVTTTTVSTTGVSEGSAAGNSSDSGAANSTAAGGDAGATKTSGADETTTPPADGGGGGGRRGNLIAEV